jgi:predicted transcriptional regulator
MSGADEKALVAQILSSYLSNNTVAPADLPSVIESVKRLLQACRKQCQPRTVLLKVGNQLSL